MTCLMTKSYYIDVHYKIHEKVVKMFGTTLLVRSLVALLISLFIQFDLHYSFRQLDLYICLFLTFIYLFFFSFLI